MLDPIAQAVVDRLRTRGETLCVAESLTGGGVGVAITSIPGSSDVFLGGITAYHAQVKESLLKVAHSAIGDIHDWSCRPGSGRWSQRRYGLGSDLWSGHPDHAITDRW
jgi:nicotinamide mononucleotide (NMN) deamidase PncC